MHVVPFNRNKVRIQTTIKLEVERFSFDFERGGPSSCFISATGEQAALDGMRNWLGGYIKVFNDNGTPVYWGKLDSVSVIKNGQRRTFTLSDVRNRIRCLYTFTDGEGVTYPLATDWAEDADSIANYGIFEEQRSVGETTEAIAEETRDRVLADLAQPSKGFTIASQDNSATLRCMSLFESYEQVYANRPEGREVYMGEASIEHMIGWGHTSDAIGFADKAMHLVNGGTRIGEKKEISTLQEGDQFLVSGSASNNGVKNLFLPVEGKFEEYTFGDVAFNGIDDIDQPSGRLGFIRKGVFIHITGSEFNDGYHLTDNPGREHTTTDQNVTGDILTENGLPVTIRQGETLRISEEITTEIPGATITMTHVGVKIMYTFTVTSSVSWNIAEFWIMVRRQGTPIDNLQVDIHNAPLGVLGAVIDSATLTGASLPKKMSWVKWYFGNDVTFSPGNTYAFVVSRTGANSNQDFYYLGIDENLGHAGTLGLWNGSAWVTRPQGQGSVPFQIWGYEYTTTQLYKLLLANNQYFTGILMNASSTIVSRLYRDGMSLVSYEIEQLMNPGSEAQRIKVRVSPEWHLIVEPVPVWGQAKYILRGRQLLNRNGHPLEQGVLPVGEWCIVEGEQDIDAFMIGFLEYTASSNEITEIRAVDAPDPWNLMVRQG
jgi:hypothetical protein